MRRNARHRRIEEDGPDWFGTVLVAVLAATLLLLTMH